MCSPSHPHATGPRVLGCLSVGEVGSSPDWLSMECVLGLLLGSFPSSLSFYWMSTERSFLLGFHPSGLCSALSVLITSSVQRSGLLCLCSELCSSAWWVGLEGSGMQHKASVTELLQTKACSTELGEERRAVDLGHSTAPGLQYFLPSSFLPSFQDK